MSSTPTQTYVILDPCKVIPYQTGRKTYTGKDAKDYPYVEEHMHQDGQIAVFTGDQFQGYTKTSSGFISALRTDTLTDEQLALSKKNGLVMQAEDPAKINFAPSRISLDMINYDSQEPLNADTPYYVGDIPLSSSILTHDWMYEAVGLSNGRGLSNRHGEVFSVKGQAPLWIQDFPSAGISSVVVSEPVLKIISEEEGVSFADRQKGMKRVVLPKGHKLGTDPLPVTQDAPSIDVGI